MDMIKVSRKGVFMSKIIKKHNRNKINVISCKDCCRQMGDYIDGKLTIEEDIAFVNHVKGCRECREEFHNYYNFMTNLYFLNYGYSDKYPASEEVLMAETEEIVNRYRKNRRNFLTAFIILIALLIILGSFIGIRHFWGI